MVRLNTIFNGSMSGSGVDFTSFARNLAITEWGIVYAVNEPRWSTEERLIIGAPVWNSKYTTAAGASQSIIGVGFNHDDSKCWIVVLHNSANKLEVYEWDEATETITQLSSKTWTAIGTEIGAPGTDTFQPVGCTIHHGLILVSCQYSVSAVIKGYTCIYSQDGVTWNEIIEDGGTRNWTPIAGGVADGKQRISDWSGPEVFPLEGYGDLTSGFVLIADYISKTDGPKGGQVYGFRVTRASETGTWTVQNAREMYQRWETTDSGGLHLHTAGLFRNAGGTDFVAVVAGDVDYRNYISLVALDVDDYLNSSLTVTEEWHGGWSATSTAYKPSPQPVQCVPHPDGGILASGDENYHIVDYFGKITSASDDPIISPKLSGTRETRTGSLWAGFAPLYLDHNHRVGYVSRIDSNEASHAGWMSYDGNVWGTIPGTRVNQQRLLTRDRLICIDASTNTIYVTNKFKTKKVAPIKINPGAMNVRGTDYFSNLAVGTGNARNKVYWDGTNYRYVTGDAIVDGSPSIPPPNDSPIMWEAVFGGTSWDGGRWYVQDSGTTWALTSHGVCKPYMLSLSPEVGMSVSQTAGYSTTASSLVETQVAYQWFDNQRWTPVFEAGLPSTPGTGRALHRTWGYNASGTGYAHRFLMQLAGLHVCPQVPYSGARNTAAPSEVLKLQNLPASANWTVEASFWRTRESVSNNDYYLLAIVEDANNYTLVKNIQSTDVIEVSSVVGGIADGSITIATNRWPQETGIRVRVSCDGTNTNVAVENFHLADSSTYVGGAITPAKVVIGDQAEDNVPSVLVGNLYWSDEAETESDLLSNLGLLEGFTPSSSKTRSYQQLKIPPTS